MYTHKRKCELLKKGCTLLSLGRVQIYNQNYYFYPLLFPPQSSSIYANYRAETVSSATERKMGIIEG